MGWINKMKIFDNQNDNQIVKTTLFVKQKSPTFYALLHSIPAVFNPN
jgi:hypothetical protein